jgi:hypothetical protein
MGAMLFLATSLVSQTRYLVGMRSLRRLRAARTPQSALEHWTSTPETTTQLLAWLRFY